MNQNFFGWTTFGHDEAIDFFLKSAQKNQLPHANLIVGPSRVGKTTLAFDLACLINLYSDEEKLRDIALMSLANGIDGLIISNSTTERPKSLLSKNRNEIGGLSGKPLFIQSTLALKKIYYLTNKLSKNLKTL